MPRRTDIHKIMLLGSGPIVIGQACEFDYSGTQACKVLMEEGFEVVLVNSNPATIMTDPSFSHRTYIEPLVPEVVAKIIQVERPDALLPTLGGQTALNLAVALSEDGTLEKYGVELIGANYAAIHRAEARDEFRSTMATIGLRVPESAVVNSLAEARAALAGCYDGDRVGGQGGALHLPLIIRPSFTLGGHGGGVAATDQEFDTVVQAGLDASPTHQVLLEESVIGWKEFELEVMRDRKDNVVIVCSIENIDPMGVHTGDSVTVAPQQTLTDPQYQRLRDASLAIIRAIGVETGGSNIQFAYSPETDELVVIEMNPRVSRSSALASKATGFPIAKIAAKLAVGYTLDEIANDITRKTPACFEPTIDYVVVKTPRWAFEKFPQADARLTTHMKSVGENMAIGRTFKEAFQKSMRSRELDVRPDIPADNDALVAMIAVPSAERYDLILEAYRRGVTLERLFAATLIDEWFLNELREIVDAERRLQSFAQEGGLSALPREELRQAKRLGFSDAYIARFLNTAQTPVTEDEVRYRRMRDGVIPTFKSVDTCAAEFEAYTPYFYSTYEQENEALRVPGKESVIILGSGPNRIGQGIEFDYCCVHAVQQMRELGYQAIMVNCNPETVSTDYDTSDRLYFEPLTFEDVMGIIENERPKGVVVQFGGQTPLKIAERLAAAGVPIMGTSQDAIDLAEDRERFGEVLRRLGLKAPPFGTVRNLDEALTVAERIGYPVLVRPSYVLGGRAMEIVYDEETLRGYLDTAVRASPKHPVLIDRFLEHATEIDVDALCDGNDVYIGAVMQHVEQAGVHSGDSACVIPPVSVGDEVVRRIEEQTAALARELGVVGLMNVQYAVQQSDHGGASIYVLEVNPRGSRTVPFVSKATGVSLARIATRVIAGQRLRDMGLPGWKESLGAGRVPCRRDLQHVAVKEAVLPFPRFPGVDTTLGPEMKSTGEVMGVGASFPEAFAKAELAAGDRLPREGTIFMSVADADKDGVILMALTLSTLGFRILATGGTHRALALNGIESQAVLKHTDGEKLRAAQAALVAAASSGLAPDGIAPGPLASAGTAAFAGLMSDGPEGVPPVTTIVDLIEAGEVDLVINIPRGRGAHADGYEIRRAALRRGVPTMTNAAAAHAAVQAIAKARANPEITVTCLQDLHGRLAVSAAGDYPLSREVSS
ncbi:MAG: carbamoyl-phosphate synthase large subunit [Thermoleophilia bacterium]|nr:carbamoyl-phosphate synthase large subunit [Thermoleophilia bacterium]